MNKNSFPLNRMTLLPSIALNDCKRFLSKSVSFVGNAKKSVFRKDTCLCILLKSIYVYQCVNSVNALFLLTVYDPNCPSFRVFTKSFTRSVLCHFFWCLNAFFCVYNPKILGLRG